MITQEHELNIIPGRPVTIVHASQYDKDSRDIMFSLYSDMEEFAIPSSASVTCVGTKKDKKGFSHDCDFTGNKVTVKAAEDMTAVAGDVVCEIVIENNGQRLGSANFILKVEDGALGEGTDMSPSEVATAYDILNKAQTATNRANEASALIEDMTVSASKVSAGGKPTAKLTKVDNHYNLALGLVTGDKGNKGDAATIKIGNVTTGEPGEQAKVTNSGTTNDAVLDFTIPLGNQGPVSSVNGGIGDVAIGGTQILRKSNEAVALVSSQGNGWADGLWHSTSPGTGARTCIEITDAPNPSITVGWRIDNTDDMPTDISQDKIPLRQGQSYTMSCYFRGAGTASLKVGSSSYSSNRYTIDNPDQWERKSFTFQLEDRLMSGAGTTNVYFGCTHGTIEICGMKLELGTIATDWSASSWDLSQEPYPYIEISTTNAEELVTTRGTALFNVHANVVEGHLAEDLVILQLDSGIDALQLSRSGDRLIFRYNDNPNSSAWPSTFKEVLVDSDRTEIETEITSVANANTWRVGDTLRNPTLTVLPGVVTSNMTVVYIQLPLGKMVAEDATVNVSVFNGTLRGVNGYIDDANTEFINNEAYDVRLVLIRPLGTLRIVITKKTGQFSNTVNNTPISMVLSSLTIEFIAVSEDESLPGPEIMDYD